MYINSGVTVYGSLSDTGASDSYTMYVSYNAASMSCYLTTGLGGYLVVYGQYGSAPTTTTYYWDAMENGGSIATSTYSNPMEGNWYFMVYSQSGGISYQLTITITYNTGSGGGGGIDMSGAIVPILASFILLFIFVIILASSRVSTSRPGSRSSYRPYQTPSDASSTIERQAQVVAPRLVQCKRCGASMKQGEDYCWNCGTPTRPGSATSRTPSPQTAKPVRSGVCMVCKRGLEKTDEILFCPYCGSLAHKDDLLEWLHVKDYCPTCGRHLDENEVKRQADPQSRPRNRGTQS
jgi:hypothetical protein